VTTAGLPRRAAFNPLRQIRGFTLLELMVVVLIIGIITTFASLSMGSRALDDQLENEALRLNQVMSLAEDDAQAKGITIGFRQTPTGYDFLATAQGGQWASYAQSGPLRARTLPEPMYMELTVEGHALPPPTAEAGKKGSKIEPQILFLSSGEATAFTIKLGAHGLHPFYQIAGNVLGTLSMTRQGDSP
jgi:general secretion pathway protein H